MEQRRSRQSFTRTLERIAEKLATKNEIELHWQEEGIPFPMHANVRVTALWVVGSYARGAEQCGDLDLLLDYTVDGHPPSLKQVSRAIWGSPPDVSVYRGTPEKNSSLVEFPEAKEIWSPSRPDWRSAIASIPVDFTATRFARKYDLFPVRPEQLYVSSFDDLDRILAAYVKGLIAWEWVPAEEINVDRETWPKHVNRGFRGVDIFAGRKTKEMLEMAVQWLQGRFQGNLWHRTHYNSVYPCTFWLGNKVKVCVGQPYATTKDLDTPDTQMLVLAPHRSRRGPNGLWVITRGVNHPREKGEGSLASRRNRPRVRDRIRAVTRTHPETRGHSIMLDFEHGHWWATCRECGTQWLVLCIWGDAVDRFSFEQVTEGKGSCTGEDEIGES